jgi:hypothetical protein
MIARAHARPNRRLLAFAVALSIAGAAARADQTKLRFLWDQANSATASAKTKADFLRAAEIYGTLASAGACNGSLFHNMGTALLQADQYDAAIAAFLRAERHRGETPETRRNLLLAIRGKTRDTSASLPWYRVPLFWHFKFGVHARIDAALCAWVAVCAGIAFLILGRRRAGRRILAIAAPVLIIVVTSVWTSLHQEYSAGAIDVPAAAQHGNSQRR